MKLEALWRNRGVSSLRSSTRQSELSGRVRNVRGGKRLSLGASDLHIVESVRDGFEIDGVVTRSSAPFPSCLNQAAEDCLREFVFLVAAFRMPLHTEHPVVVRGRFDGFNDAVVGGGDNLESVAGHVDRLVMAGVDPSANFTAGQFAPGES